MTTTATWTRRVEAWRASGLTAEEFSHGRGFAASTLRWWSSRLRRGSAGRPQIALARVVACPDRERSGTGAIVIEVAGARVLVANGVESEDLVVVLDALEARARGGAR